MGYCFVPQCNHRGDRCSLFRFPKTPQRRREWESSCRRKDSRPGQYSRICSCHFSPSKRDQPKYFPWTDARKRLQFHSPQKRKSQRPVEQEDIADRNPQMSEPVPAPGPMLEPVLEPVPESVSEPVPDTAEGEEINADETGIINFGATIHEPELVDDCTCNNCPERRNNAELKEKLAVLQAKFDSALEKWSKEKSGFEKLIAQGDAMARAENYFLKQKVEDLEKPLLTSKSVFSFNQIESDDGLVSHYTGLPNKATLELLVSMFDDLVINYYEGWNVVKFSRAEQIFISLMKLRRNFTHVDLGTRFGVSENTIANIVMTWIHAIHYVLIGADNSLLSNVPSRFKNQKHLPKCFEDYPNTRFIIDCTEVRSADPKLMSKHNKMFSNYKHYVTGKGLIGISPDGTVTFASELYPGSTSDNKDIVSHCKILDKVERGDAIMADKGFLISSLLPSGVSINLPPFKETPQFTPDQIEQGFGIAQARVHVERAIQRVKLYHILDYIPQYYRHVSSKIFQVCAALTNFRRPLIQENTLEAE